MKKLKLRWEKRFGLTQISNRDSVESLVWRYDSRWWFRVRVRAIARMSYGSADTKLEAQQAVEKELLKALEPYVKLYLKLGGEIDG